MRVVRGVPRIRALLPGLQRGRELRQCRRCLASGFSRHGTSHIAQAGRTVFEICAITGHTPVSVQMICKHYLRVADHRLPASAVGKLLKSFGEGP